MIKNFKQFNDKVMDAFKQKFGNGIFKFYKVDQNAHCVKPSKQVDAEFKRLRKITSEAMFNHFSKTQNQ